MKTALMLLFFCIGMSTLTHAQNDILNRRINILFENDDFVSALEKVKKQSKASFSYSNNFIPKRRKYNLPISNLTVREVLNYLLENTNLTYEADGNQILIFKKSYFEIYGQVKDGLTKELLTAATVYIQNTSIGISTNEYGYYSLKLPEGSYNLVCSYIGMQSFQTPVRLNSRKRIDIELQHNEIELDEVLVDETLAFEDIANAPLNQKTIMDLSENTPHIGGDPDLLHVLRAQSGVQSSPGGVGGLYVRGSNSGHNLVLLDGVPVYNWMHLMGLNSIFNPNAVRGVQFYTSGFSARYGGRLASVVDIQSREGHPERFSGMAGVNQRSYHGHLSGPLLKEKGAFWIGGRHSFIAPYVTSILKNTFYPEGEDNLFPRYYDWNVKLNQQIGMNDRIYMSHYQGKDDINGETIYQIDEGEEIVENALTYGNTITSIRWNHIYNNNLFSNLTLNSSRFFNLFANLEYIVKDDEPDEEFAFWEVRSDNNEQSIKLDFDWITEKHHVKFGGALHNYRFEPFITFYDEDSEFLMDFDSLDLDSFYNQIDAKTQTAFHTAFYAEDDIQLSKIFKARLGVRFTSFFSEEGSDYHNFEPRLLLTARWNDKWQTAASLTRMVQYLHLISNTDIGLPQDLWLPSSEDYEPAESWQTSLDIHYHPNKNWKWKGAAFYKTLNNILSLPDTVTAVDFGSEVTSQLQSGEGETFGSEISAFFQYEKWSGFGAYTLSWANRFFEGVNEDEAFPFKFDARHYAQLLLNYKINKHFQIGLRGHFSTPRPILASEFGSLETGLALRDINPQGEKNTERDKIEHRLDVNFSGFLKTGKVEHRLSLEVYNTYNEDNSVFYYLDDNNNPSISGMNLPMMFSAYYSLKF